MCQELKFWQRATYINSHPRPAECCFPSQLCPLLGLSRVHFFSNRIEFEPEFLDSIEFESDSKTDFRVSFAFYAIFTTKISRILPVFFEI